MRQRMIEESKRYVAWPNLRYVVVVFLALQSIVVFFTAQYRALASSFSTFRYHTQRRVTVGRTPLDEWPIRRRDLYLTTHNTHNTRTSTWQHTTLTTHRPLPDNTQNSKVTDIHAPRGIRTHNLSRWTAAELRLRPSGHWDRFRKKKNYWTFVLIFSPTSVSIISHDKKICNRDDHKRLAVSMWRAAILVTF